MNMLQARPRRLLTAAAIAAAAVLGTQAASAAPVTLTVDGAYEIFGFSGLGAITSPADGYQVTVGAGGALIDVVDCCIVGDEFDVTFDDGASPFTLSSSAINPADDGVNTGAITMPDALADGRLSSLVGVYLSPGLWDIDIVLTRVAAGTSFGDGFIQARSAAVSEPALLALFGLGLLGIGVAAQRRRGD
ncbi:MAG: PEP-CTERM sorting domain-containing protein [Alphaproteobacteria bacterium]|nr:PEP-CTERM sorting domain-containing protein [Alphaproteobacteria bacterium]MDX5368969.1 PEP-CTERM sorting domain-containing protein [Alphaproteobacteria bacterium]MDX5463664.1 PEP-CTERM sorting domain-containing protein [Alphaproteobacteria bacterium]